MWNKERITKLLTKNDRAVERAIVAIYDRQTPDEKATSDTRHDNHRGFRSNHASKGSYYARWVLSGRHLTGHHLANARKIALQYHRQLCEVANAKEIDKQEDEREHRKASFAGNDDAPPSGEPMDPPSEPPVGTWAATARMMVQCGLMTGDEADAWKDEMKEGDL
jgi:hypothetical protein